MNLSFLTLKNQNQVFGGPLEFTSSRNENQLRILTQMSYKV